jgi:hypothetical protein
VALPSFTAVLVGDRDEAELLHMLGRLRYQTRPPDETIAVVSRIDTRPLARDFRDVQFVEQEFAGDWGHSARRLGHELASGEWVGWFNSDDDYRADYIERMLERAVDTGADAVYCAWNRQPECRFGLGSSTSGNFIVKSSFAWKAGSWRTDVYEADGHLIDAIARIALVARVDEILYWHNERIPASESPSSLIVVTDEGATVTAKKPAAKKTQAAKSITPTTKPAPNAKAPAKTIALRALAEAKNFLGVTEHPSGSNRQMFGQWFGENGVAWCAIFASYCFEVGGGYVLCHEFQGPGVVPGKGCAYVPTIEGWAKDTGKFVPRDHGAEVGYLALFNWNGGAPDHVGIVEKVHPDGTFDTIEGNTEDGAHTAGGGYVLRQVRRSPRLVDGFVRISG